MKGAGEITKDNVVVPERNTIFASILIGYADSVKADRISLANHADDNAIFPDTRPEWVAAIRLTAYPWHNESDWSLCTVYGLGQERDL